MSLYDQTKRLAKLCFKKAGFDVQRIPLRVGIKITRGGANEPEVTKDLPPLFDDPLEALYHQLNGKHVAFRCPLRKMVVQNGLSYSSDGWHPFVAALQEYGAGKSVGYKGSTLEQFYEKHRPAHAGEAIAGFEHYPNAYANYPPVVYRLAPWQSGTPEQSQRQSRKRTKADNAEHGATNMLMQSDGHPFYGPVSDRKGELEYRRLTEIFSRFRMKGFDRAHGHVGVALMKRETDFRFLLHGAGNHRTPAMAALKKSTIPAIFTVPPGYKNRPPIIDIELAQHWPQVRGGLWTKAQAEAYFHHLFDFDSIAWARKSGLV
jgi:hypothetical protein